MNAVMLDFDGVLNSVASTIAYHHLRGPSKTIYSEADRLDPIAIGLLKYLVDATDAKIIVSSTWRMNYSLQEFVDIFASYGWKDAPFIGKTGRGGIGTVRGDEIEDWLNTHPEVSNYVIIDDDSDMLPHQLPHFVNTSGATGFTLVNLCEALRIFGVPNSDLEAHAYFTKPT
jgi:HAD domain in Swiss Army Knife RNA repair proteins